jgi:hypothetical protein
MRMDAPFEIELEYVQRMMAWLLFVEPASVPSATPCSWGWGRGLTKFCHKKLRMKTTAIELNPQVLAACRAVVQAAGRRTQAAVVLADAAEEIASPMWLGTVDALQVDLYDHEAAAPGAGQRRPSMPTAAPADRGRLHDGQPVWPLVQLRAQPEKHGRAFGEGRALGLQAHARGQHRGAGPAHAQPAQARRCWRRGPKPSKRAGACPRQVAAGVQTAGLHERPTLPAQVPRPKPPPPTMSARWTGAAWWSGCAPMA